MPIKNEVIEVETDKGINIYNITPQILKIWSQLLLKMVKLSYFPDTQQQL
jgi:hypothetical protein